MDKSEMFNTDKIDRKLELSQRKRQVWAYVASKTVGESFTSTDAERDLMKMLDRFYVYGSTRAHLHHLVELDLLDHSTQYSNSSGHPYTKLPNENWPVVEELLTKHGVHLPLGAIGEQLTLPIVDILPNTVAIAPENYQFTMHLV